MVFSLQVIVIAVTVSAAVGVFDCIPRVAPRRSIRSRHCGMNEPIGSVQPVVPEEPVEIVSAGGRRFPCWIGSMRGSMRVNAGGWGRPVRAKSTLMNIIGCLDRPTSGDYLFCGREVGRLDDDELSRIRKSRIGFVFQNFNLLPRLTAAETSSCRSSMPVYRDASVMTEPWSCSGASGSWIARDIGLPSCREARSSALPSHGHWSTTRP